MKPLICFFLLLFCAGASQKRNPHMTQEERKHLEAFFELLVRSHDLAYTLFGEKPFSIADYQSAPAFTYPFLTFEEGWDTWLKYNHLFPSKNFVLRRIDCGNMGRHQIKEIVVINKRAALDTLNTNIKTFQDQLHTKATTEEILSEMLKNDEFLKTVMDSSERLGILLGYGNRNAKAFKKRTDLMVAIKKLSSSPFKEQLDHLNPQSLFFVKHCSSMLFESEPAVISSNVISLGEELNEIVSHLDPIDFPGSDFLLEKIQPPIFAAVQNDPETKRLYKSYEDTRERILDAYRDKSIFEVTINQWTAQ